MRAQERKGKERKGEAGKRPPQSSRNSPGIHDKTRERRACRSPPPLLSFATSRQTKRRGGRAHKRRPICACLPSALSFLPLPTVVRKEEAKRRDEERRGMKKVLERGAEPSFSYLSLPILFIFPAVPSITWTCEKATRGHEEGGDSLLCYFIVI